MQHIQYHQSSRLYYLEGLQFDANFLSLKTILHLSHISLSQCTLEYSPDSLLLHPAKNRNRRVSIDLNLLIFNYLSQVPYIIFLVKKSLLASLNFYVVIYKSTILII